MLGWLEVWLGEEVNYLEELMCHYQVVNGNLMINRLFFEKFI